MLHSTAFARRMATAPPGVFVVVAGLFSFLAYCCIYAFRKPFTAATYADQELWGIQFKIVLVTAQVFGYALSKFLGIRIISGMTTQRRSLYLIGLVGVGVLSLLGFALMPAPWNVFWMFVNGIPLGMAWGLIFSYLEGRRVTEALAAMLCANFVISSGLVKSIGKWLLISKGVSESWMPFTTAMLFLPLVLVCLWVLEHLPPPSAQDIAQRSPRQQMSGVARKALFFRYAPGLILLVVTYLLLTIIRDVRDNFAVEIWDELGFGAQASILITAEIPIAFLTLVVVGAMMFVKSNFRALWLNHLLSLLGALLLLGGTFLFQQQLISPLIWMVTSGFGLFLPYILFNGVFFDRLMASFQERGNVGFLMYVADSIGYLGSVGVMLWRNFGGAKMSWLDFYMNLCTIGSAFILLFTACSFWYFLRKKETVYPSIPVSLNEAV